MRKLFICILFLNYSGIARAQFINDHEDIGKADAAFSTNKHLKTYTLQNLTEDPLIGSFKFIYDSTNNELFKVIEDPHSGSKQNEYSFNNEQLYRSKTEWGINYFFIMDYSFQNPFGQPDEAIYKTRESIKAKAYSLVLLFRNHIVRKFVVNLRND